MRIRKGLIVELTLIVIFVAIAILMYNYEIDLILFKVYNMKTIKDYEIKLEQEISKLETARTSHKSALTSLEEAKNNFNNEKAAYESISDETLAIINEATQGEEYNIEYMWIALGNYAKENNLEVVLYEPGSTVASQENQINSENEDSQSSSDTQLNNEQVSDTNMNTDLSSRNTQNMRIKVQGTYINVSEFIYDLENDSELRFNLDNIRMEYMENNEIAAIFEVKGLILNN